MSQDNPIPERQQLEQSIAALEAQRPILGNAVVDAAVASMRKQLADLQAAGQPEQQRKLLTVLFADLVGFTSMSERLDPEEVREIQQAYFSAVTPAIQEQGGLVEKYIGDAVLAVFGLPQAREDDPERAVRAALEMQAALQQLNLRLEPELGVQLRLRVGVNTGLVMVSMQSKSDFVVTGDPVNLAARLQSAAPPGGILISHDTYRHVPGVFDLETLEPVQIKGKSEPVPVYLVLRAKPRAFRRPRYGVEGVQTRLIGRELEIRQLQNAFQEIIGGEMLVITITGEAGLGKSRLMDEFEDWVDLQPQRVILFRGRARPETQRLPYSLLRDLFAFRFGIQDDDPARSVRQKFVEGFQSALGAYEASEMQAHIAGHLLGYDFRDSPHLLEVGGDAQQLYERGISYLIDYFKAVPRRLPLLMILEDLHWADDSSLDAIPRLALGLKGQPALLLAAARPALYERRPHWFGGRSFHNRLDLQPLSRRESHELVDEVLQKVDSIPATLRDLVIGSAEGNPFYVEELVKMLVDDGVILKGEERWSVLPEKLAGIHVPPTLTGVLQARLDSLPSHERTVLQQASVVGRVFWDAAVSDLSRAAEAGLDLETVIASLESLRLREMIYRRDLSAFAETKEHTFKHAILREVTYESVLKRLRRLYHARVADWLIQHSRDGAAELAGLIADHLERAGRQAEARFYLRQAADEAAAKFANQEALDYYSRLLSLEDGPAERMEILLRMAEVGEVSGKLQTAEGHAQNALRQAELLHDLAAQARCQYLLGRLKVQRADFDSALSWMNQALQNGETAGEWAVVSRALTGIGWVYHYKADYAAARRHLESSLPRMRLLGERANLAEMLNILGLVTRDLGEVDTSRELLEESLGLYREIDRKWGISAVLTNLGLLAWDRGDYQAARALHEESLVIARAMGARRGIALSLTNLGATDFILGDYASARQFHEDSLALLREIDDKNGIAVSLTNLGLVALEQGDFQAAGAMFKESLLLSQETGSRVITGWALINLASMAARQQQQWKRAVRLMGAASTLFAAIGAGIDPDEKRLYDSTLASARLALGEAAFQAEFEAGREMTIDDAIALALEGT